MSAAALASALCAAAVAGLLVADRRGWAPGRVLGKMGASSAFVAVAALLGAWGTPYGRWVLAALVLGWIGDALLLSRRDAAFRAGLGAFLVSHLGYAGAFLTGALSATALGVALVLAAAFGAAVLRWLWPHTPPDFRVPVLAYVVVILAMCTLAAGHAAASGRWAVLGGALLFAASDLSVARDRFVEDAYLNRLWGWPAYFAAQLVLAWSVAGGPAAG